MSKPRAIELLLATGAVAALCVAGALIGLSTSCSTVQRKRTAQLPPLAVDPFAGLDPLGAEEAQPFTFRSGPKPPADTLRRQQLPFPPPAPKPGAQRPAVKARPLKVLRTAPKQGVSNVGSVTVTFDQPMVPVASLAALQEAQAPVTIHPRPPGRFRWLGTQTVAFEPGAEGKGGGRMPYATDYTVTVPAGTRSAIDGVLERAVSFSFSTPTVEIVRALPARWSQQARPDTAIALELNQPVPAKALLALLRLNELRGGDLELVPRARWGKLPDIGRAVETWEPDRTIVLQPRRPLRKDTQYLLRIAAGLQGEGPKRTTGELSHGFRTYAPLRVDWIRCGHDDCDPAGGLSIRFNNPLVTTELQRFVALQPPVPDLELRVSGNYASLQGELAPRTRYAIAVRRGPVDIHDQPLAQEASETLRTGDRTPELSFPARGLVALERSGKREVPLRVVGVRQSRLRMVRVAPEQILQVMRLAQRSWDDGGRRDPLKGIKGIVVRRTLQTGVSRNGKAELGLRTDEALGPRGAGPVFVELRSEELRRGNRWANPLRGVLVQVTDIGLMARYDPDQIVALASDLQSGKPIAGAALLLRDRAGKVIWRGKSDGDGLARAPGRRALGAPAPYVLWARRDGDRALLVLDERGDDGGYSSSYAQWGALPEQRALRLHLFTDRSPYRPGETVHLKGVLRVIDTRPTGGVEPLPAATRHARYEVTGPRGHKLSEGEARLSPSGAFALDVEIPAGADLGHYTVRVTPTDGPLGRSSSGTFRVEEYRAPEFKVQLDVQGEPYFIGDALRAEVGADYLFGAPMAGARCRWTLTRSPGHFAPPGNDGFTFAEPVPLRGSWQLQRTLRRHRRGRRAGHVLVQRSGAGDQIAEDEGQLDARGRLSVREQLARDPDDPRVGPLAFTLEAEVADQNRQQIADRKTVTAHPASRYVGLRAPQAVIKAGEEVKVEAVLVDLAGQRVPGVALTIEALKIETKISPVFEEGRWTYKYESQQRALGRCAVQTADVPRACAIRLPAAGAYTLRAAARDDQGRATRTALRVYAFGPGYVPWELKNQSRIELVPDKARYQPGDTAKILVKSPLRRAIGLLTVQRGGIERAEVLRLDGNAGVIEVPIAAHHLPDVHVGVGLARGRDHDASLGAAAKDLGRPTFAHGSVRLPVSVASKELKLVVTPARAAVGPADELAIALRATDHTGRPVQAELALMLVDEGVLSLLGYQTPDPLAVFHAPRGAGAPLSDLRNALLGRQQLTRERRPPAPRRSRNGKRKLYRALDDGIVGALAKGDSAQLGLTGSGRGGGRGDFAVASAAPALRREVGGADNEQSDARGPHPLAAARIRSRSHFATTAYYNPSLLTDAQGRAAVTVKLPDNLTTYRIMAVALDRGRADRFGRAEAQVQVRKALLLRPSLPRFLSVGDRFEAAVMVHNETDRAGELDVLVRGRNAVPDGPARTRLRVPAHGAKEVRFAMKVQHAGPARVQFGAVLGRETDAVEKQLPVLLPVTTEAFATYGVTEDHVVQPVRVPRGAIPGYGGLEVSMASTALNGLEDAVRYLVSYPHECTEQTASRLLPIFSLEQILSDFDLGEVKDRTRRAALARAGVRKLISFQRFDGGWGNWQGSQISWLYTSAYATYALLRAKAAGEQVPQHNLDRARRFLAQRLDRPLRQFGEQYHWVGQTAALWVLSELGQHEQRHLDRLYGLRAKLPLFARAWLMVALHRAEQRSPRVAELLREIDNAAILTPSAARFAEGNTESLRLLMHSNDRTDAIVLAALLEVAPEQALIPKIARGLLQARVRGRWSTTQANAYALVALARYYAQVERVVPQHVSELWYGEGYMGEGEFSGRELKIVQQQIPLGALARIGDQPLVLAKKGRGKLYYRIGLRYAPTDLTLPPEEQGFSVSRSYEPIAGAGGEPERTVRRLADGTWEIRAGATVRVRVVLVVPDQRYFVAVVDPLPAGLEGVNLAFETTARTRLSGQLDNRTYDTWSWYSLLAFDHRELRDDRVVLFADRLPAGVYEYTYLARATSLGDFVAAPTKVEEMYRPETFGRAATTRVRVK